MVEVPPSASLMCYSPALLVSYQSVVNWSVWSKSEMSCGYSWRDWRWSSSKWYSTTGSPSVLWPCPLTMTMPIDHDHAHSPSVSTKSPIVTMMVSDGLVAWRFISQLLKFRKPKFQIVLREKEKACSAVEEELLLVRQVWSLHFLWPLSLSPL